MAARSPIKRTPSSTYILDHFPKHIKPRRVQAETLLDLQKHWNNYDVFVLSLPVASGKSAISCTISKWVKRCAIITPTNMLVKQYTDEYRWLHALKSQNEYRCSTFCQTVEQTKAKLGTICPKTAECTGCDAYRKDLAKTFAYPYLLGNFYSYMGYKAYRPTLIVDEAHKLIELMQALGTKKLWHSKYQYPKINRSRAELMEWAESIPEHELEDDKLLTRFKKELFSDKTNYLFQFARDRLRGEDVDLVKMIPLDVRDQPEPAFIWPPSKVQKIVLMSGTIGWKDLEEMGLKDRRIRFISAPSPIPPDNRPVLIPKEACNMSLKHQEESIPKLVEYLQSLADYHHDEKGLVHVTYSVAKTLVPLLLQTPLADRIIFHGKSDKKDKYQEFRDSRTPKILVASGMYEGIDLPYDACRWQVLTKVPWPSLMEPAIQWRANNDKEWYQWATMKTVMQAIGRVSRTPIDYGATYVWDTTFRRLYQSMIKQLPLWFQQAVTDEEEL